MQGRPEPENAAAGLQDAGLMISVANECSLATKVEFLKDGQAFGTAGASVSVRETHMSWIFLAGNRVYKLKKPVRFPYLDFSTLAHREAACRAELRLNRRLSPDVYVDVVPLTMTGGKLAIRGSGSVVDWLVEMRRLDEKDTLEHAIAERRLATWQLDRLVATLVPFYRRAEPSFRSPALALADWSRNLSNNRHVLLDPRLGLPTGLVTRLDGIQRQFVIRYRKALVRRVLERRIVDCHGDLRPEHIWLGDPVRVIDCLEFNRRLRAIDPFDEIAFLSLECERLGAKWAGDYIRRRIAHGLRDGHSEALFLFYRCYRATLRARLAIAHLLERAPRTPEKWPRMARQYLKIAATDAVKLERLLKTRKGRRGPARSPAAG
jgi:aminoglycoside phosphotransferase family enzyme